MSEEKSEKKRENEEKSAGLSNSRQNYPKFGKNTPNPLGDKGKSLVDVRSPLGRNGSGYKISKKKLKEVQLSNNAQVKVSVDRVTLIGQPIGDETIDCDRVMHLLYKKFKNTDFYKQAISGFNIVDPKTDENVAYVEVPTHRTDEIRVDFNPKRLRWDLTSEWAQFLIWFLQQLENKKFSRLDLAFDMLDVDVRGYLPYVFGASKSLFYDRAWNLGTIYAGARSSKSQIRFYDKKAERKQAGYEVKDLSFWRLELQLRGNRTEIWRDDCAKKLGQFYKLEPHGVKNLNDKVLLLAMKQDPNIYKEFSKNTQTKIRRMMNQPDNQEYTVTRMLLYCLGENYEKLEQELNFYLAEFGIEKD